MILRDENFADLTPGTEVMMATWKILNTARGLHDSVDLRALVAELRKTQRELGDLELLAAVPEVGRVLDLAEAALKFIEAWEKAELGGSRA